MTKPSNITQWLLNPASFSEDDRKEAAALLKSFPYFVPARYMEAAEQHKKQPFAPSTMSAMQLYRGNWINFYEFLQSAGAAPSVVHDEEAVGQEVFDDEVLAGELEQEEEKLEDIEDLDEEVFSEFESWEDDEEFTVMDEEEEEEEQPPVPAPKPAPAKPSKPAFTRKGDQHKHTQPVAGTSKPEPAPEPTAKPKPEPVPEPVAKQKPQPKPEEKASEDILDQKQQKQQKKADPLIQPIYTEEYFLHQGINVSDFMPVEPVPDKQKAAPVDKSLMVVMSFAEWLTYFKTKGEKIREEVEDQKALKTMWQKEKLAAALEEENEEIPESVFEMAVNSITKEDDLASESLAEIMIKQGKYDKAIDMYRKLSLRNPQKSAYFARKIDRIIKENES